MTSILFINQNQTYVISKCKFNVFPNPETVDFGENDKVEIFLKKLSDNDFSKKPIFSSDKDVKSAEFSLPVFEEMYDHIYSHP